MLLFLAIRSKLRMPVAGVDREFWVGMGGQSTAITLCPSTLARAAAVSKGASSPAG
jgi:hypothetical protein